MGKDISNHRTMDIIIQSLGFKAGDSLESFIREKVNGLKSDHIIRANVVLYKGAASNPENDYCEIRLEVPGNDHFVKKHSPYFETSVSECVEILTQMLKKSKDKHVDSRQADAVSIQDALLEGGDDSDVELEDVVK
ncbi:MAG: HPF/RaiA family ribosome-associated protein [Chitinophagaceae bacterium]|nr:MAG: HPF/RaiA family ribosome-associated protein [Chitinophagaceae bacterium]